MSDGLKRTRVTLIRAPSFCSRCVCATTFPSCLAQSQMTMLKMLPSSATATRCFESWLKATLVKTMGPGPAAAGGVNDSVFFWKASDTFTFLYTDTWKDISGPSGSPPPPTAPAATAATVAVAAAEPVAVAVAPPPAPAATAAASLPCGRGAAEWPTAAPLLICAGPATVDGSLGSVMASHTATCLRL